MTLAVSNLERSTGAFYREARFNLAFDSSYPSGGEALTPAMVGLSQIHSFQVIGNDGGYLFSFDNDNSKLQVLDPGPAGGSLEVTEGGSDIKGSVTTNQVVASSTTIPTNANLISTVAAANNTTAFTIAASPDLGRNVCVGINNNTGGTATGNAADYAIVGTWKGAAQNETISFSAGDLTDVPDTTYAVKYGSKPFDTITSITPSAAQPANWRHVAGIGSKVGLHNSLKTPAEADVLKITKNAANLAVTGLVNTTNMTVNLGTLADNDDFQIVYAVKSGEVAASTNLSGTLREVQCIAHGI